jgi:hypothetical protein
MFLNFDLDEFLEEMNIFIQSKSVVNDEDENIFQMKSTQIEIIQSKSNTGTGNN